MSVALIIGNAEQYVGALRHCSAFGRRKNREASTEEEREQLEMELHGILRIGDGEAESGVRICAFMIGLSC